jgi:glutamine amidotransferase
MTVRIAIVDYGMGNIRSVHNALARYDCAVTTTFNLDELAAADAIVLPGVGAFGSAMANLRARNLVEPLITLVRDEGKPILGICLGMQLLADRSEEHGEHAGLGLIPGTVRRIHVPSSLRLPHVGWNGVSILRHDPLFVGAQDGDAYYFVHSYHFACDTANVAATADYGGPVVAAVQDDHVYGMQFHPERSQSKGLQLLGNFVALVKKRHGQEVLAC